MTDSSGSPTELSPVKQALLEIRRLNARITELENKRPEPIAVTGMALRFPGASNPESFWDLLANGVDAVQEVPPTRWDLDQYYSPELQAPGKMSTRYGAFLDDIDQFDARFFGISPREAASMDPQQRLLLETTWEALERAGQAPDQLFDSQTSVYLGMSNSDYYRKLLSDVNSIDAYVTTGNALSVAGGRLSYILGLHGPNLVVDTACSSSLVALHLAISSLRSGESALSLVGGVNLILSPELTINFSIANMLAPDGRCKAFDASANGYIRGEGCAVLVLKRLSDAQRDGDPILAVIRGSAVNHDGRSGGLTAPNGPSQIEVIRAALENAGVDPLDISYIEAHGTGTPLGDPIEIGALVEALCQNRPSDAPLYVGSVKTNIGHLEAAAGIAGVIKTILAMQHRQIPAHLHFTKLNPHIVLNGAPIQFPTQKQDWLTTSGKKRIAGVSSFGLSGTNAHVILEEAPEPVTPASSDGSGVERPLHILAISAKSASALPALAERMVNVLAENPSQNLADVSFSANTGRAQFNHRLAVIARTSEEARQKLTAWRDGQEVPGIASSGRISSVPEITFLFTGQGANYLGMGRQLYQTQPVFHAVMDRCDALLRPLLERPLLSVLFSTEPGANDLLLRDMRYAQPALFSLQMALAELWQSWGIQPTFVAGHSLGEYAAACLAGVFTLEDGLKLVAGRGRAMQSIQQPGIMAAVFAPAAQVAEVVKAYTGRASVAAINAPTNTVISGESSVVEALLQQFEQQGVKVRRLAISQASHSPLIEPALDEFSRVTASIHYSAPQLSLVSTLTGRLVQAEEISRPDYWTRHLRQPVLFEQAMHTLQDLDQHVFVEIGPHPVLLSMGKQCLPEETNLWVPSLRENLEDWQQILESLAALWTAGAKVDWRSFDRPYPRQRVLLPTYPFERSRYWALDTTTPASKPAASLYQSAAQAAHQQSQQGPLDLALSTFPERWNTLERLTTAYMTRALHNLGAFAHPGECWTVEEFVAQFNISPVYRSLMKRWLEQLARSGLLQQQADQFTAPVPLPEAEIAPLVAEAKALLADSPMVTEYIERCGERLASVLTGESSALDTLFPNGSDRLAVALYRDWSLSRYYGFLVRSAVEGALRALPENRPTIRIIELGAGTGATTSHVLPVLPADRASYFFTDVSGLFLNRAAENFRDYPFVQYAKLDIEKYPADQGFAAHSFDLVIATNVLHAVPSLKEALRHTLNLLAPGGLLILNEVTTHLAWFDISTGLIEGWQVFNDSLRDKSPLLSATEWLGLLRDCGFTQVSAWPEEGTPPVILGQHVIIAQAPLDQAIYRSEDSHAPVTVLTPPSPATPAEPTQDLSAQWATRLEDALPGERLEMILNFVRQKLAQVLRLPGAEGLEREQRLIDLGLDSLMALELRAQLCKGLGLPEKALSATLAFDYPTIQALAAYLLEEIIPPAEDTPAAASQPAPLTSREAEVADLSDEEIEALLLQKLNKRSKK